MAVVESPGMTDCLLLANAVAIHLILAATGLESRAQEGQFSSRNLFYFGLGLTGIIVAYLKNRRRAR